jgi:hypothetical protein
MMNLMLDPSTSTKTVVSLLIWLIFSSIAQVNPPIYPKTGDALRTENNKFNIFQYFS